MEKILLYGVGTYKNKGVEAIIQSTINQIDKKKYNINIASHDYNNNKKYYTDKVKKYIKHYKKSNELSDSEKDLEIKYQNMPFDYNNFELLYQNEVVDELEKSDICISVGGDNYCYDFCTWLYALDKKAHDSRKKTVLWGASLFENIEDQELINDMRNFDVLVIRESLSYNAIKKYIPEEKIIFVPDPAFSLEIKKVKLNDWYKNRKYMILNLSPLTIKNKEGYKAVLDLVNHILKDTDYSICLLPHVTTPDCNDLTILKKISNKFKSEDRVYLETENYNCNELKYIISKAELLVAARTHATIAAYSTCVPTLVIGYSVKAKGIAKDLFGSINDYVIPSNQLSSLKLIEKFDFINKNKNNIRKTLEKQMPDIKEKSKNIFNEVIKKLDEQEKMRICRSEDCVGCGVCAEVCPKDAITMKKNNEGFLYPYIDMDKCIECNRCRKVCPILKKTEANNKFEPKYYGVKNKNVDVQINSTSGGVFSVLAEMVLKNNGVVYGCEFKNNKASHIRIDKLSDLVKIRGSKYIQSSIMNSLSLLKKDLDSKRLVLYSGTPCQIGAIKAFLGKDYDNLLTTSFVCHGVMNDELLKKYLTSIEEENNGVVESFEFRTKENGWTNASIKYKINGTEVIKTLLEDDLMFLFLKDYVERQSCYNCKFKDKENKADFIMGDYWGIEVTNPDFLDQNGVSFITINSKKADTFIKTNNFFDYVHYVDGNIEEIEKYNPSISKNMVKPYDREIIFNELEKNTFEFVSKYCRAQEEIRRLKNIEKQFIPLREENINLVNQLNNIYNSKRWKITDKSINMINKVIRRK